MEKDANVVVVFGGTNDYGHGDAALLAAWQTELIIPFMELYITYIQI